MKSALQSASDSVIDCPSPSCRYEICWPAYASAAGVQSPVTGMVAACVTCTVSFPPGSMVALTPEASNHIRAFVFCASSSIVGLAIGNVARAAYLASTASRNAVIRLWPPPRSRRFAWWNIHGSVSPRIR